MLGSAAETAATVTVCSWLLQNTGANRWRVPLTYRRQKFQDSCSRASEWRSVTRRKPLTVHDHGNDVNTRGQKFVTIDLGLRRRSQRLP